jgi:hypothetical protein
METLLMLVIIILFIVCFWNENMICGVLLTILDVEPFSVQIILRRGGMRRECFRCK